MAATAYLSFKLSTHETSTSRLPCLPAQLTKLMLGPSLTLDDTVPDNVELPLPLVRCLACAETFVLRKESAIRHCDKDLHRKLISMTYGLQEALPASSAVLKTEDLSGHEVSIRQRNGEEVAALKKKLECYLHRERQKRGKPVRSCVSNTRLSVGRVCK